MSACEREIVPLHQVVRVPTVEVFPECRMNTFARQPGIDHVEVWLVGMLTLDYVVLQLLGLVEQASWAAKGLASCMVGEFETLSGLMYCAWFPEQADYRVTRFFDTDEYLSQGLH